MSQELADQESKKHQGDIIIERIDEGLLPRLERNLLASRKIVKKEMYKAAAKTADWGSARMIKKHNWNGQYVLVICSIQIPLCPPLQQHPCPILDRHNLHLACGLTVLSKLEDLVHA